MLERKGIEIIKVVAAITMQLESLTRQLVVFEAGKAELPLTTPAFLHHRHVTGAIARQGWVFQLRLLLPTICQQSRRERCCLRL